VYSQALSLGIANYTALAQKIKTEVEKIMRIEVQLGTIVVAIKRFVDTLNKERQEKDKLIINYSLQGARLSLTGSIIDVDFEDTAFDEISNILDEFFEKESGSYNIFQTNKQLRLFAEDLEEIRKIASIASKKFDGKITEGLSKIRITVPSYSEELQQSNPYYNILFLVSDILHDNQIPLHNAFFDRNEIVLILRDKDAARAYELLRAKMSTQ
jgi:hypothetical protein